MSRWHRRWDLAKFSCLVLVSFFLLGTFAFSRWSADAVFVKEVVLHVVDAIRLVRTDLDALLLNAGFADPSSHNRATLGLLDVVARIPYPRARIFCAFAPEITREEAKDKPLVLVAGQRHGEAALDKDCRGRQDRNPP